MRPWTRRCAMAESSPLDAPGPVAAPRRRAPRSGGSRARRRFAQHRMAVVGAAFLAAVVLAAISAPVSAPYRYDRQELVVTYHAPRRAHSAGAAAVCRDEVSPLLYGAPGVPSVGVRVRV